MIRKMFLCVLVLVSGVAWGAASGSSSSSNPLADIIVRIGQVKIGTLVWANFLRTRGLHTERVGNTDNRCTEVLPPGTPVWCYEGEQSVDQTDEKRGVYCKGIIVEATLDQLSLSARARGDMWVRQGEGEAPRVIGFRQLRLDQ
jgi:hypothetical protein